MPSWRIVHVGELFFFPRWLVVVVEVVVRVLVAVVASGLGEIKWGKQEKDGRRSFPCPYSGTGQELVSYLPDGWMGWMDGWRSALLGQAARVETGRARKAQESNGRTARFITFSCDEGK